MDPILKLKHLWQSSPSNKRTLVWALKFLVLFVVFLIVFYPLQQQLSRVASTTKSLKIEIEGLKKISVNLLTPQEVLETEKRVKDFESKVKDASQASALLDAVTNEADKNHLNVIQIYSESPISVRDDHGKDVEFQGKKLLWLPVSFRVEADYKNLGNFLKTLSDDSKSNFVVESLQLQRSASQAENLQCDITLSFIAR